MVLLDTGTLVTSREIFLVRMYKDVEQKVFEGFAEYLKTCSTDFH